MAKPLAHLSKQAAIAIANNAAQIAWAIMSTEAPKRRTRRHPLPKPRPVR